MKRGQNTCSYLSPSVYILVENSFLFYLILVVSFFLLWIPRIASERNRAVYARVVESLYFDYGGKEQCPWNVAQLRGESFLFLSVV